MLQAGQIVILNGAPRSGKSSIAQVIEDQFDGLWVNLGVDMHMAQIMPQHLHPGIGLRPGGERPDLEPLIAVFYAALYESIAAHSRLGLNVVADFGHHDAYSRPMSILKDCAARLQGLPVLFVGVRCSLDIIMERRNKGQAGREDAYLRGNADNPVPSPVLAWQEAVHAHGVYDLEVDTSHATAADCAEQIRRALAVGADWPTAFERIAST